MARLVWGGIKLIRSFPVNDIRMETRGQEGDISWMKTLSACTNQMKREGYTEDFQVVNDALTTYSEDKFYQPEDIRIVNFYRFEGTSDPGDNSVLYVIETRDGVKGTLVDAYGAYSDDAVSRFIVRVEEIRKQVKA